jgi:aminocarboxymuconate-semialdehyde decarboxylase
VTSSDGGPPSVDIHGHLVIDALLKGPNANDSWRYERGFDDEGGVLLRRAEDRVPCLYEPTDVGVIVQNLDVLGINLMAINVAPFQMGYELDPVTGSRVARIANEAIAAAVEAHPRRLVGMGTLPLRDSKAAIDELEWILEADMAGVELGSNVGGVYLGDPRFRPVWRAIDDAGAAVFIHPMNVIGADRLGDYFLTNLIGNPVETARCIADVVFSGLLDDLPDLRICFAHGGGAVPSVVGRWDHGFHKRLGNRVNLGQLPSEYLKSFHYDHITHSSRGLRFLIDLVGADRVMIGSDYPFDMGFDDPVGFVADADVLTENERSLITSVNARRFLRCDA